MESQKGDQIPIDYRRRMISLMKRVLGVREFLENPVRPYSFAVYLGKDVVFQEKDISNVRFINLRISTGDPTYGLRLYNGLSALKGKIHKIGNAEFVIKDIKLEKERDWTKGSFKSLSPVVVEKPGFYQNNPRARYLIPMEEGFEETLLENILRRFRVIKGYEPNIEDFSFSFKYFKEEFIKHYGGHIRAFLGRFHIRTNNPEILKFVYQYGLGLRTGQGFGYLEVD